jgi:hypothetical protein
LEKMQSSVFTSSLPSKNPLLCITLPCYHQYRYHFYHVPFFLLYG